MNQLVIECCEVKEARGSRAGRMTLCNGRLVQRWFCLKTKTVVHLCLCRLFNRVMDCSVDGQE